MLRDVQGSISAVGEAGAVPLSRLGQAVLRCVVSPSKASETAEQHIHRRADRGLHVLFGPTPQRVHLHQVHRRQKTCRAQVGLYAKLGYLAAASYLQTL